MSADTTLATTARHHRRMADQVARRIVTAQRRLEAGQDAGFATDVHQDHLTALQREHDLWVQLAAEIETYLATDATDPLAEELALADGSLFEQEHP